MSKRITIQDIRDNRVERWLPDTEIVNDEGKVIAYIPPPIKPMPMSWRERVARWLFRLAERIDPLVGITTEDDKSTESWRQPMSYEDSAMMDQAEGITTEDDE